MYMDARRQHPVFYLFATPAIPGVIRDHIRSTRTGKAACWHKPRTAKKLPRRSSLGIAGRRPPFLDRTRRRRRRRHEPNRHARRFRTGTGRLNSEAAGASPTVFFCLFSARRI